MKFKRSKILALIMLVVSLVLTINLPVMADSTGEITPMHTHVWEKKSEHIEFNVYKDSYHHADHFTITYSCYCGQNWIVSDYENYGRHEWLVTSDYHSGKKHYFDYECTVCHHSSSSVYDCSGSPCITPFSLSLKY